RHRSPQRRAGRRPWRRRGRDALGRIAHALIFVGDDGGPARGLLLRGLLRRHPIVHLLAPLRAATARPRRPAAGRRLILGAPEKLLDPDLLVRRKKVAPEFADASNDRPADEPAER